MRSEGPGDPQAGSRPAPRLMEQLPWRKLLIWGLFVLAIYTLRHLFFIIFMTFLLSFVVRTTVQTVARRLSPNRERLWLERGFTLITFAIILVAGVEAFKFVAPRIFEQGRALLARIEHTQPQVAIRDFRNRTAGAYLFRRKYGKPGTPAYDSALADYKEMGQLGEGLFNDFPSLSYAIEAGFESQYDDAETRRLLDELTREGPVGNEFDTWFLQEKADELFQVRRDYYIERWFANFATAEGARALAKLADQPDFAKTRDDQIRQGILSDLKDDSQQYAEIVEEWKRKTINRRWRAFRESPEYLAEFREYFEQQRRARPHAILFDFETYLALKNTYPDKAKFASLLAAKSGARQDETTELVTRDFKLTLQEQLAEKWWTTDPLAEVIRGQIREDLPKIVAALATWGQDAVRIAATVPIQLITALLLSIFITFDMTRLTRRVRRLHDTRIRNVYAEIAPGLVAFARLMGRAFMAQGVIALFNTLLTFAVMWLLGIENAFFLCAIVFACSFIPVLGVILSGVPIALMAILQPGGSLWLAAQSVIGIIIIHLIESSLLNPSIVGNILHLHPFMVLAVLTVGEHFFGLWGLLLAVPVWVFIFRIVILNEQIPGITDPPPQETPAPILAL